MPGKFLSKEYFLKTVIAIILVLINTSIIFSQGRFIRGMDTAQHRWGSWNVLLKPGLDSRTRFAAIQSVENSILQKIHSNPLYSNYHINFQVFYCPCDSLLYNIGATLLNGSGSSATTPPPPPGGGGSGGSVLLVSTNNRFTDFEDSLMQVPNHPNQNILILSDPSRNTTFNSKILAVIDTGIDTSYFSQEIKKLIWSQKIGRTIYNVIDAHSSSFFDNHIGKHGTIVAALALQALKKQNILLQAKDNELPRLMIIKALDGNKQGSTFTVSCALSYAIQNHAALINASLGYYEYKGNVDSVFRHYVNLSNQNSISLFVAAGNVPRFWNRDSICYSSQSELITKRRMFYPACFSTNFNNVFTITGLKDKDSSCFYQNYSPRYVSLGVLQTDKSNCCHFSVPFANGSGTSFATPVASGIAISYLLNSRTLNDFKRSLSKSTSPPHATRNGNYISY